MNYNLEIDNLDGKNLIFTDTNLVSNIKSTRFIFQKKIHKNSLESSRNAAQNV